MGVTTTTLKGSRIRKIESHCLEPRGVPTLNMTPLQTQRTRHAGFFLLRLYSKTKRYRCKGEKKGMARRQAPQKAA